jgi:zinc/manganese transport system permease protein
VLRWITAVALVASGVKFAAAPRADQPLVDAAEYAWPSLRTLYFSRTEQATFADAGAYAERYRLAADTLNDEERKSRSAGTLDDFGVARLSSFLKSYSEMRRGEQFVMDEVRGRARERVRWVVAAGLFALALIAKPLPWRRLKRSIVSYRAGRART